MTVTGAVSLRSSSCGGGLVSHEVTPNRGIAQFVFLRRFIPTETPHKKHTDFNQITDSDDML